MKKIIEFQLFALNCKHRMGGCGMLGGSVKQTPCSEEVCPLMKQLPDMEEKQLETCSVICEAKARALCVTGAKQIGYVFQKHGRLAFLVDGRCDWFSVEEYQAMRRHELHAILDTQEATAKESSEVDCCHGCTWDGAGGYIQEAICLGCKDGDRREEAKEDEK